MRPSRVLFVSEAPLPSCVCEMKYVYAAIPDVSDVLYCIYASILGPHRTAPHHASRRQDAGRCQAGGAQRHRAQHDAHASQRLDGPGERVRPCCSAGPGCWGPADPDRAGPGDPFDLKWMAWTGETHLGRAGQLGGSGGSVVAAVEMVEPHRFFGPRECRGVRGCRDARWRSRRDGRRPRGTPLLAQPQWPPVAVADCWQRTAPQNLSHGAGAESSRCQSRHFFAARELLPSNGARRHLAAPAPKKSRPPSNLRLVPQTFNHPTLAPGSSSHPERQRAHDQTVQHATLDSSSHRARPRCLPSRSRIFTVLELPAVLVAFPRLVRRPRLASVSRSEVTTPALHIYTVSSDFSPDPRYRRKTCSPLVWS